MGTLIPPPTIPDPVPPGDPCDFCWGPGKPFGLVTPEELIITVTGIEKGPNWMPIDGDPPNGVFILSQPFPAVPCFFISPFVDPRIGIFFDVASTGVDGEVSSGEMFFEALPAVPCLTVIENELDDHFTGGTATITIPPVT